MEPVKHLSWSFLKKELTAYSRKQFLQVPPYIFERVLKISTLTLMNPTPLIVNTYPKSIDLMESTSPLFNNSLPQRLIIFYKNEDI